MTKKRAKRRSTGPSPKSRRSQKDSGSAGGLLMGLRRGTKQIVGQEEGGGAAKKKRGIGVFDIVLWGLVIALLIYGLATRLT